MYSLALHLTPVLAADKSKVPFYVAGGLLVVWALVVSLGIGIRRPDWPNSASGQRAVVAISAVLVLGAVSTAVITSVPPTKNEPVSAGTKVEPTAPVPVVGAPVPAAAASGAGAGGESGASSGNAGAPTATTGTPAPPSSPATGKAGSSLRLAANPSGALSYNTKQLSAKAGAMTVTMANMSPVEHNLTIAQGNKVLGATPSFVGGAKTLRLQLSPGKYTFYCSVPGHRQAGMEGTLSVS